MVIYAIFSLSPFSSIPKALNTICLSIVSLFLYVSVSDTRFVDFVFQILGNVFVHVLTSLVEYFNLELIIRLNYSIVNTF